MANISIITKYKLDCFRAEKKEEGNLI